ncbi:MAG: hypothetical protein WC635_10350 [Bacteriovorax sp.]|jgi:hypothetical protein
MFKKLTALLLLAAFTNVYAAAPIERTRAVQAELNKTFDSLNYKLNVEWNQKDAKYFDETVAGFEKEIAALQKDGLTKQELMKYTLEKIKDQQIKNEVSELAKVISESQMTDAEARAFTVQKLNSTYSHGASWSGSRLGVHTALIIGAIIIILVVAHHHDNDDDETTVEETPPKDDCEPTYDPCEEYDFSYNNNYCEVW